MSSLHRSASLRKILTIFALIILTCLKVATKSQCQENQIINLWESLGHRQLGDSTPTNPPCDAEVLGRSSKMLWKSTSRWGMLNPCHPLKLIKPSCSIYYLPLATCHFKENCSTTKLKVFFDASARSNRDLSLNDTLLIGPTMYPNFTDILIRFRS